MVGKGTKGGEAMKNVLGQITIDFDADCTSEQVKELRNAIDSTLDGYMADCLEQAGIVPENIYPAILDELDGPEKL